MVCGGFACSKNALCALNVVYMLVGLLLIGVAAWGKGLGLVSSIHIIGGVIAVGVFLLLIAVAGLVGAVNHHQVLLFFYMIILGLVFIFQFGISCSCLAINRSKQTDVINASWWVMSNSTRHELERSFDCCGLFNLTAPYPQDDTSCGAMCKTRSSACQMCGEKFLKHSDKALKILGGVGLFFSFTEILGVWLAMRFRNQKDPEPTPVPFYRLCLPDSLGWLPTFYVTKDDLGFWIPLPQPPGGRITGVSPHSASLWVLLTWFCILPAFYTT